MHIAVRIFVQPSVGESGRRYCGRSIRRGGGGRGEPRDQGKRRLLHGGGDPGGGRRSRASATSATDAAAAATRRRVGCCLPSAADIAATSPASTPAATSPTSAVAPRVTSSVVCFPADKAHMTVLALTSESAGNPSVKIFACRDHDGVQYHQAGCGDVFAAAGDETLPSPLPYVEAHTCRYCDLFRLTSSFTDDHRFFTRAGDPKGQMVVRIPSELQGKVLQVRCRRIAAGGAGITTASTIDERRARTMATTRRGITVTAPGTIAIRQIAAMTVIRSVVIVVTPLSARGRPRRL
mmetsp:Transcript_6842/g.10548  ORF Transcript_6842/g.10548 Transcript_6842/m.10548 type:complete len:294 (+) Transcript_6842:97-978(+)